MSKTALQKHKKGDKIKWVITFLVGIGLVASVAALTVKLNRQTTTTTIGGEAYSIGAIGDDGLYSESNSSIYMRKSITTDGLKCELAEGAKIKYQLFYYDKDNAFISKSSELTTDFDGIGIPETAKSVKIVITPTADEDGKVSLLEVLSYASQLTVTVNR